MVAGVIRISDKFELGDKTSPTKPTSNWNDVTRDDCNNLYQQDGMNSFAFGIGATLFLIAQCILIAVWICIYQRHKTSHKTSQESDGRDECDENVASGNFGSLFPIPPILPGKGVQDPRPDFREFNPYTADLFRRRTRDAACDEGGDFPSLVSVSSVDSSIASAGTTMYASLVNPRQNKKSKWPKRNFNETFSTAEAINPVFDFEEDQRKA